MGHSSASLYRKTSRGWPLTKGSFGNVISFGDRSVEDALREPPLSAAARAFARGLNVVLIGPADDGEGRPEPPLDTLRSDAADRVRGPMGTMRLCRLWLDDDGLSDGGGGRGIRSGSGGASAAGTGRPRAAATS